MTTPPPTVTELRHVAGRVAALAAEAEALAETVDRARPLVRPAQEVIRAVDLHRALADTLDGAGDLGFDPILARGLDRARSLSAGLDRSLNRASGRARALERALDLDDELDEKFGGDLDDLDDLRRGRDLVRVAIRVTGFFVHFVVHWAGLQARFLVWGVALSFTFDDAHSAAWGIRDTMSTMEARVWTLLAEAQGNVGCAQTPAVSRLAQRMLEGALGVLPVKQRPRYREELLGDLHALARSGASRRAQLGYAFGTARRMWSVQRALRTVPPTEERVR